MLTAVELKLGSIPLVIQGRFFLMALLLGLNEHDPARLAVWVAVVFVSVVIHELGHALMGMAFGLVPRIELQGMGGLTSFTGGPTTRGEVSTARSIAISLAGPFAGFGFALVILGARLGGFAPGHPLARHAITLLLFANVAWGVFNLMPMLPLDGGNVMRSGLKAISKERGESIAQVVSIAVAVGIGLWALTGQQWWVLYLGAMFGFQNVQAFRQQGQRRVDQALADAIQQSFAALDKNDTKQVIQLLQPALAQPAASELRETGLEVYVVALMREARWDEALGVLTRERAVVGPERLRRFATFVRDAGRTADAEQIEALGKAPAPLSEFRA